MAEHANRSIEASREASHEAESPSDADVMREVGRHVRHGRARRGMTRRQLAAESEFPSVSPRSETGQAIPRSWS